MQEAANTSCLSDRHQRGLFALESDVLMAVPSVNLQVLAEYHNCNIVAIADNIVSQLLTAITLLTE